MTSRFQDVFRGFDKKCSMLGEVFFSDENRDILQKSLVLAVFKARGVRVAYQSDEDLLVVMRRVFTEHAAYVECRVVDQVRDLNRHVVDAVLPGVLSSVDLHFSYLKDIGGARELLDYPVHHSYRQQN